MPFPLAHPSAVLPLKRYSARWLNFPALVIGSLVPDAAYIFRNDNISGLSHRVIGSIAFGLPVGFLMLAVLYVVRKPAVEMLSDPARRLFISVCRRPIGPLWLAAASLMIGIWSHVFWDSFTHNDGWIATHVSILQAPLLIFAGRTARVCHVLWYASTFVGVAWLFVAFENWKWSNQADPGRIQFWSEIRYAILLSILVIPVSLVRHLVRNTAGFILTALMGSLLALVFAIRMIRIRRSESF